MVVGEPLPTLPLWLTEDLSVPLELEASYADVWRVFRIKPISYTGPDSVENWPTDDGQRDQLGPFMAYPHDVPKTFALLRSRKFPMDR